ncbi:MAG: hypothetical protein R3C11_18860 [Planctomycetaceae bacterium]
MLKITQGAWNRLLEIQSTRPDMEAVRLRIIEGRLKCRKGIQQEGDCVIAARDRPTILMSPKVAQNLSDCSLDVQKTDNGFRLRLKKFEGF